MTTQKAFDRQVEVEVIEQRNKLPFPDQWKADEQVSVIWQNITYNIAKTIVRDRWSDIHSDSVLDSVYVDREKLRMFLAGMEYEYRKVLPPEYVSIISEWKKINDPEYAKYLELKEKFEGKK